MSDDFVSPPPKSTATHTFEKVYPHEKPLPENVVTLDIITTQDLNPEQVLRDAYDAGINEIVVVGFTADGKSYFASSVSDAAEAMYHLTRGIHRLNTIMDDIERGGLVERKP